MDTPKAKVPPSSTLGDGEATKKQHRPPKGVVRNSIDYTMVEGKSNLQVPVSSETYIVDHNNTYISGYNRPSASCPCNQPFVDSTSAPSVSTGITAQQVFIESANTITYTYTIGDEYLEFNSTNPSYSNFEHQSLSAFDSSTLNSDLPDNSSMARVYSTAICT